MSQIVRPGGEEPAAGRWPAVTVELHPWAVDPRSMLSRRQRSRIGASYEAIVVPHIAEVDALPIAPDIAAHAEDAAQEIARFDATYGQRVDPYGVILLRTESAASSRIEQLDSSAKAVALAEIGDGRSATADEIVANSRAMDAAIDLAADLTASAIIEMQHALLGDVNPRLAGGFRDVQVWIGGSNNWPSPDARMIAPHPSRVPAAIEDLVAFIERDDLTPVLAQIAIAHAQFETIHPFPDGHGRTGRALSHAMLRAKQVTRAVTVPLSAGLLKNVEKYFQALDRYRDGDPTPVVEQFADAAYAGINNATQLAIEIAEVEQDWADRAPARRGSTTARLRELLIRQPAISTAFVVSELGASESATHRAIDTLVDAGILTQAGGGQRYRKWVAPDVLDALDRFTDRCR